MNQVSAQRVDGEYPRPEGRTLDASELQPADVLLSRGPTEIADRIVAADRGSYSHCALWSGDKIIESTLKGGIEEHAAKGERDVYRFNGLRPEQADAIVQNARKQVGAAYAVSELHLLALVSQKWWPFQRPRASAAEALLSVFGGKTAEALRTWLQDAYVKRQPRICSELVALAYFEAGCPLRVLALDKRPAPPPPRQAAAGAPSLAADMVTLHNGLKKALREAEAANESSALEGALFGTVAVDADTGKAVGIITPGDFQFSPSLTFVGTLRAG